MAQVGRSTHVSGREVTHDPGREVKVSVNFFLRVKIFYQSKNFCSELKFLFRVESFYSELKFFK